MDLGIHGRKAIVCASSKGLGKACALSLAREGCNVVINGRDRESLDQTAREIQTATGAEVLPIVADIATEAGRAKLASEGLLDGEQAGYHQDRKMIGLG